MRKTKEFIKKTFVPITLTIFLSFFVGFYFDLSKKIEGKEITKDTNVKEYVITPNENINTIGNIYGKDKNGNYYKIEDNINIEKTIEEYKTKNKNTPIIIKNKSIPIYLTIALFLSIMIIISCIIYIIKEFSLSFLNKKTEEQKNQTLNDIKGLPEEQMDEIKEYITLIKQEDERIKDLKPKGLLLGGPAGVGKTSIGKAITNEAGMSFFYISGSSIGGMIVGKGARDIRKIFEKAKKASPSIIFIDEFDSIAKSREGNGTDSSGKDGDLTVNEILTQMDGFDTSEEVYVIAATNYPEKLDKAITRSGRFNRKINIPLPNKEQRSEIANYYLQNYPHQQNVTGETISSSAYGMSGADIKLLIEEAYLLTIKNKAEKITNEFINKAKTRMVLGSKIIKNIDEKDKLKTAYHESGHAFSAIMAKNKEFKVEKISIEPRGQTLGTTFIEESESYSETKLSLYDEITVLLSGRAAEEVFCGEKEISSGCSNDLERATYIAENLITKFGLGESLINFSYKKEDKTSTETIKQIDNILKTQYKTAVSQMKLNKDIIMDMALKLMDNEIIYYNEIEEIFKKRGVTI